MRYRALISGLVLTVFLADPLVRPCLAQPGPGGGQGGGGGQMQQAMQRMGQMLDTARKAPPESWPQQKQQLLERAATNMKKQNPSNDAAVQAAVTEIDQTLEQARGLTEDEYAAQKQQLTMRLVRSMGKGMGRQPGGGGMGPGGGGTGPGGGGPGPGPGAAGTGGGRDGVAPGGASGGNPAVLKAGDLAPDFTLKSLDGKSEIKLSGTLGRKPVCLVFGSYT